MKRNSVKVVLKLLLSTHQIYESFNIAYQGWACLQQDVPTLTLKKTVQNSSHIVFRGESRKIVSNITLHNHTLKNVTESL